MAGLNQIIKKPRRKVKNKLKLPSFEHQPFVKGICLKIMIKKPKKPNSALRKVAKVKLSTNKIINAHIPGEGHNLQEYATVLVRGGRCRDLPGVKYKLVRGKYDLQGLHHRTNARSKYGGKKNN